MIDSRSKTPRSPSRRDRLIQIATWIGVLDESHVQHVSDMAPEGQELCTALVEAGVLDAEALDRLSAEFEFLTEELNAIRAQAEGAALAFRGNRESLDSHHIDYQHIDPQHIDPQHIDSQHINPSAAAELPVDSEAHVDEKTTSFRRPRLAVSSSSDASILEAAYADDPTATEPEEKLWQPGWESFFDVSLGPIWYRLGPFKWPLVFLLGVGLAVALVLWLRTNPFAESNAIL